MKNANTEHWHDMERALVVDIVDKFLAGEWTPPWRCGFCRDRIKKLSRPKW